MRVRYQPGYLRLVQRSIYMNVVATARRKPLENLYPWIQFSLQNCGIGSRTVTTDSPAIGCSQVLILRVEVLIGQTSFFLASSGLRPGEPEFRNISVGTRSATASPRC
jgi:hypothetical protein